MFVAEIVLSIVAVLGCLFFLCLFFWTKWKNQETKWKLKLGTISIILLCEIGLFIIDLITKESWGMGLVLVVLWIVVLVLNATMIYREKNAKKKESKEKENL